MEVKRFDNNVEVLRPIADIWRTETQGNAFGIEIDVTRHLADLQQMARHPDSDLLILVADNGQIVGYMGVMLFQSPLGSQVVANERYLYVLPQHRGIAGLRLIKAAEQWAKSKGCTHIQFNVNRMASDMHDKTCKLYERLGFKQFETSFIREL